MPENKPEKKKPGRAKRIFRWIGWGLFAFLLVLSIHFRLPWKAVVLFLGLPLTLALVPKRIREWITYSVAAACVAIVIWVFLPSDNEGWRPYTFDEELAALEAKYAIPDEENAAVIYNQLLKDCDPNLLQPDFMDDAIRDHYIRLPWPSYGNPQLAQWLRGHQGTIERLLAAAKKPKCRCPISAVPIDPYRWGSRLRTMFHWAQLLVYAANNDVAEGRTGQALEKLAAIVQMAEHLRQQPIQPIELLVAMGVESIGITSLNGLVLVRGAQEEYLSVAEEILGRIRHEWSEDLPRILEGDKLLAKNIFGMVAYEVNREGKVRMNRDLAVVAKIHYPGYKMTPTYAQLRLAKVSALADWLLLPSNPHRAARIIDEYYKDLHAMARPDFKWPSETKIPELETRTHPSGHYLIRLWTGPDEDVYHWVHNRYQQISAHNRGGLLIIGLRRYKNKNGRWPETLDEIRPLVPSRALTDPINNGAFVYRLDGKTFRLYSRGKNNIDEGGRRHYGADDWLFSPRTD
ncbi:MAG: type IV pilus modification PilV family protein [Planctomycetota bacterium]|jgi:hypothetical protein